MKTTSVCTPPHLSVRPYVHALARPSAVLSVCLSVCALLSTAKPSLNSWQQYCANICRLSLIYVKIGSLTAIICLRVYSNQGTGISKQWRGQLRLSGRSVLWKPHCKWGVAPAIYILLPILIKFCTEDICGISRGWMVVIVAAVEAITYLGGVNEFLHILSTFIVRFSEILCQRVARSVF